MIVPAPVSRRFRLIEPYLKIVNKRVHDAVLAYCAENGFAFLSRSKTLESLAEKIESGRYRKWSDLDDLYACTIVVPTLFDEDPTLEFLTSTFQTIVIRQRGKARKAPDVFRFDATRFIGRLNEVPGIEIPSEVFDISFEVQIRSAFEHAWSSATHSLVYKAQKADWKEQRLAAQLKSAVEQLDNLIMAFEKAAEVIVESPWPEMEWKTSIVDRFKSLVADDVIPTEAAAKDWSRFCENLLSLLKACDSWPRRHDECSPHIGRVLDVLEAEMRAIGGHKFPRSVSLLQVVFGILFKRDLASQRLRRFHMLITDDLATLYPNVRECESIFVFDE